MRYAIVNAVGLAMLWIVAPTSAAAPASQPAGKALFPVQVAGKWGDLDPAGKVVHRWSIPKLDPTQFEG